MINNIDYARSYQVIKSNDLIQNTRYELTTQEQKIVLRLIQMIQPDDVDLKTYYFEISEFCELCGIEKNNGGNIAHIKATLKSLHDKSFWLKRDGKEILCTWVSKAIITPYSTIIEIRLDEDLKPYLIDLKNNFTEYSLINILSLESKYSIRFYELFKSHGFKKTFTISVDNLRELLCISGYARFYDLKKNILDVATNEINKLTDISVSYSTKIVKRVVESVTFTISTKHTMDRLRSLSNGRF